MSGNDEQRRLAMGKLNDLIRDAVTESLKIPGVTIHDVLRVLGDASVECIAFERRKAERARARELARKTKGGRG